MSGTIAISREEIDTRVQTELSKILICPDTAILEAIKAISLGAQKIALVVDEGNRLLGVVSDGDVRGALLNAVGLEQPVSRIMNTHPTTLPVDHEKDAALQLMRRLGIQQIPVLDDDGGVVGMETIDAFISPPGESALVVLMAGGLGTRLHPLTHETPKPMLPVGGRPLLETTIRNFAAQGYRRFVLSLNHRAEVVREHFGDGTSLGVEIDYVVEDKPLGTAGALGLLREIPNAPFVVMNGDVLTSISLEQLLAYHLVHQSMATMCVRDYTFQVPYGVVETEGVQLSALIEKPVQHFHINAGIYVLDPETLDLIPRNTFFDMTQLFGAIRKIGDRATVFPIYEYWLDIGQMDDLERAEREWPRACRDR